VVRSAATALKRAHLNLWTASAGPQHHASALESSLFNQHNNDGFPTELFHIYNIPVTITVCLNTKTQTQLCLCCKYNSTNYQLIPTIKITFCRTLHTPQTELWNFKRLLVLCICTLTTSTKQQTEQDKNHYLFTAHWIKPHLV
jgi:hypothetical protein